MKKLIFILLLFIMLVSMAVSAADEKSILAAGTPSFGLPAKQAGGR